MGGGALIQFILLLRDRQRAGERERERAGQREGRRERERAGERKRGMETADVREHFLLAAARRGRP